MSITGYPVIQIKGKLEKEECEVVDHIDGKKRWVKVKEFHKETTSERINITGGFQLLKYLYSDEDFKK
jgi:hypothetical protein